MSVRDAVLNGVKAANELHEEIGLRYKLQEGKEPIDVFKVIQELGVFLLFKPLDGLLGLYLNNPDHGILISSKRRLPIQRFTAAHELGHYVLDHADSLDSENSISIARQEKAVAPFQEIEAEAFAAEFIFPKWLGYAIIKRQGWSKTDLCDPSVVYQLSLRAGVSYEATWRMLLGNRYITKKTANHLKDTAPKSAKKHALKDVEPADSWGDALSIGVNDDGSFLLASPDDTAIIELPENGASGYIWELHENSKIVDIVRDSSRHFNKSRVGGCSQYSIYIRYDHKVNICLEERRPWLKESVPVNTFNVTVDFSGKEEGLPRAYRQ